MLTSRTILTALFCGLTFGAASCISGDAFDPGGSDAYVVPPSQESTEADDTSAVLHYFEEPIGGRTVEADLDTAWAAALSELDTRNLGMYSITASKGGRTLKGPRVSLTAASAAPGRTALTLRLVAVPGSQAESDSILSVLDAIARRLDS